MDSATKKALIAYLEQHITAQKRAKMDEIINYRTRHVTLLLEDIFQQHNASAIVRSIECFGVQDLHVVQDRFSFSVNSGVAMGSSKWISMHRYSNTPEAFAALKKDGYRIVATTPHARASTLQDLPLDKKFALVFGTENVGLSPFAMEHADEYVKIPMYGFTQSFNVSVSAALILYHVTTQLHQSSIPWHLSEDEALEVRLSWLRKAIRGIKGYEQLFFEALGSK
jgi:tRNA (guanosine-2'-O-)-methyltransferase